MSERPIPSVRSVRGVIDGFEKPVSPSIPADQRGVLHRRFPVDLQSKKCLIRRDNCFAFITALESKA
jgi:hypothetical protein